MFNHVTDAHLRSILERSSVEPDELRYAMDVSADALAADLEDEEVPGKALEHRQEAMNAAEEAWCEANWRGVIVALRDLWG